MQETIPPLILLFDPFDPSGAGCLPADAITCSKLGAHALSTVTALHIQDTAGIEDIEPIAPELVDDQARCLLEDMAVQAFKVGPLYTAETVSVLAQIAADYSQVPLVLHLNALPEQSALEDEDPEDVLAAIFELLLPQTDIVVADHNLLTHWQTDGLLSDTNSATPAKALLRHGAQWVLTTASPVRPNYHAYMLHGPDLQTHSWPWQAPGVRIHDFDGDLACAIACGLAVGLPATEAVQRAIGQAAGLAAKTFQPGMGQKLINHTK